jgi:hypothetical protein
MTITKTWRGAAFRAGAELQPEVDTATTAQADRTNCNLGVMAAMEAMREWVRKDGQGSFVALVNQALDLFDAGARLDQIASPPTQA